MLIVLLVNVQDALVVVKDHVQVLVLVVAEVAVKEAVYKVVKEIVKVIVMEPVKGHVVIPHIIKIL